MPMRSALATTLFIPIFFSGLVQAQNKTSDSLPTFKSKVQVVPVDVVVTDSKGEPVTGLHQEDFQILEQGKPQTISSFHEYTGAPPAAAAPSNLPPRVFTNRAEEPLGEAVTILLLDSLNTPLGNQLIVHQQVLKYFHSMKPRTPIAVFKLSSQLRLLQSFTSDYSLIQTDLADKKFGTWPEPSPWLRTDADKTMGQMAVGLAPQPRGRTPMDGTRQFEAESAASQVDMRVQLTFDAFQQLAHYLAAVPGRKNVIWFSRSFPLTILPPGAQAKNVDILRNYNPKLEKLSSQLTKAQIAIYPIAAEGLRAPFDTDNSVSDPALTDPQLSSVQADLVADDANHVTMDSVAELTGGRAAYNNNGLAEAIDGAVHHGTHYYALSYSPTNKRDDGRFRSILVKVGENQYKLDYRRGYYADSDKSLKAETKGRQPTPFEALMARGLPDATQITYQMLVQPSDHQQASAKDRAGENVLLKGSVTRYTIVIRIPAQDVLLTTSPNGRHGTIEMDLVAYDREGNPLNWLRKSIQVETKPEGASPPKDITFMQEIDVPQGDIYLRSGIYDPASNAAGTIEVPLSKVMKAK